LIPAPTGSVTLPDGRRLAYDDVGDPSGSPIVYLHGCPDCRLTRPPDDRIASRAGARVIAIDRPGYGSSDPDADGDDNALARDVVTLADALGIDRFGVIGWSSGGPGALALAASYRDRVTVAAVAAGQVPIEADADPAVRESLDPVMATRAEAIAGMSADEFAEAVAPLVAATGMTDGLAREHIVEGKDAAYLRDLTAVDGLLDQLALGMVVAVEHGLAGVERDMRCMVRPWPFDLSSIEVPVVLWYGTDDAILGPAAGRWLADRIPGAQLHVVETSHLLPLVRWESLLTQLVSHVDRKDANAHQP
jgi:pimeloyl-ACP methyl ester carboxylesterase